MLNFSRKKFLYDHAHYTINEDGTVVNEKTGNKLNVYESRGAMLFDAQKEGESVQYRLHLAVADHFLPNPNNWDWVAFKDGNFKNCGVSNLRWTKRPDSGGVPVKQYSLSGILIKEYSSLKTASEQTNIDLHNICSCCEGKRKTAGNFKWRYK